MLQNYYTFEFYLVYEFFIYQIVSYLFYFIKIIWILIVSILYKFGYDLSLNVLAFH